LIVRLVLTCSKSGRRSALSGQTQPRPHCGLVWLTHPILAGWENFKLPTCSISDIPLKVRRHSNAPATAETALHPLRRWFAPPRAVSLQTQKIKKHQ